MNSVLYFLCNTLNSSFHLTNKEEAGATWEYLNPVSNRFLSGYENPLPSSLNFSLCSDEPSSAFITERGDNLGKQLLSMNFFASKADCLHPGSLKITEAIAFYFNDIVLPTKLAFIL